MLPGLPADIAIKCFPSSFAPRWIDPAERNVCAVRINPQNPKRISFRWMLPDCASHIRSVDVRTFGWESYGNTIRCGRSRLNYTQQHSEQCQEQPNNTQKNLCPLLRNRKPIIECDPSSSSEGNEHGTH